MSLFNKKVRGNHHKDHEHFEELVMVLKTSNLGILKLNKLETLGIIVIN